MEICINTSAKIMINVGWLTASSIQNTRFFFKLFCFCATETLSKSWVAQKKSLQVCNFKTVMFTSWIYSLKTVCSSVSSLLCCHHSASNFLPSIAALHSEPQGLILPLGRRTEKCFACDHQAGPQRDAWPCIALPQGRPSTQHRCCCWCVCGLWPCCSEETTCV